jgi:hypothetical protein
VAGRLHWPGAGLSIKGEKVVDASVFSAVVVMVIVTTMVTPPFLKWSLARGEKKKAATAALVSHGAGCELTELIHLVRPGQTPQSLCKQRSVIVADGKECTVEHRLRHGCSGALMLHGKSSRRPLVWVRIVTVTKLEATSVSDGSEKEEHALGHEGRERSSPRR